MAWTTPTQRTTGTLITQSIYNTDLVDNIAYLKGQAGQVVLEDSLKIDIDGIYSHGFKTPSRREVRFTWEMANVVTATTRPDVQLVGGVTAATAGGGGIAVAGTGQIALKVDNETIGSQSRIEQQDELTPAGWTTSAWDNDWTVSKRPYFRVEIAPENPEIGTTAFVGFRQTLGAAVPVGTAEHFFGFRKVVALNAWQSACGNGAAETDNTMATWLTQARHIIEAWMHDSKIEFWIDGTLRDTITTTLPTAALKLVVGLLDNTAVGPATDSRLTIGEAIFQEDTP